MNIKELLYDLNKTSKSKSSVARYHGVAHSVGISDIPPAFCMHCCGAETSFYQYDLCSAWFILQSTVNSTVAAVQKKEMVSLSPIASGKNKKSIALTDTGWEAVNKTAGKVCDAELRAVEEFTSEQSNEPDIQTEKPTFPLI